MKKKDSANILFSSFAVTLVLIICQVQICHARSLEREFFDYDIPALANWDKNVPESMMKPYVMENIKADYQWGAISPSGNYIFVTIYKRDESKWVLTAQLLDRQIRQSSFNHLDPKDFQKSIEEIEFRTEGNNFHKIDILISEFVALHYGRDPDIFINRGSSGIRFKSIYLPFVLETESGFENLLIMLDFRGVENESSDSDLYAFNKLYQTFGVPEYGYDIITDFNCYNSLLDRLLSAKSRAGSPNDTPDNTSNSFNYIQIDFDEFEKKYKELRSASVESLLDN